MKESPSSLTSRALHPFLQKHADKVNGILHGFHGFDRVRLQRSLRYLYQAELFREYLFQLKVLWKDFKDFACGLTSRVHQSALDWPLVGRITTYVPAKFPKKNSFAISLRAITSMRGSLLC